MWLSYAFIIPWLFMTSYLFLLNSLDINDPLFITYLISCPVAVSYYGMYNNDYYNFFEKVLYGILLFIMSPLLLFLSILQHINMITFNISFYDVVYDYFVLAAILYIILYRSFCELVCCRKIDV